MKSIDSVKKREACFRPLFRLQMGYLCNGETKKKAKIAPRLISSLVKIATLLLIVGLGLNQVFSLHGFGFFKDTEASSQDSLTSASLVVGASNNDWRPAETASNFKPGDLVTRNINIVREGSLNFNYNASVLIDEEQNGFCGILQIETRRGDEIPYSGALSSLNFSPPVIIDPTGTDYWIFTVAYPVDSPPVSGGVCKFSFVFTAWQENFVLGSGWSSEEQWSGGEFFSASVEPPAFQGAADVAGGAITEENPLELLPLSETGEADDESLLEPPMPPEPPEPPTPPTPPEPPMPPTPPENNLTAPEPPAAIETPAAIEPEIIFEPPLPEGSEQTTPSDSEQVEGSE